MSGEEARGGAAPGNPTEIRDWRDPAEWPIGAKPVTRKIAYDDLYRVNQVQYEYSAGDDTWVSPYAKENGENFSSASFDHRRNMPSPHVSFQKRALEQDIQYDWLGNTSTTDDDAHGFYDRSLGTITNDTAHGKPYQLTSATNASKGGNRTGSLNAKYDVAGNLTDMAVNRSPINDAACLPSGSGCNQTLHYQWDEVGRLVRAQRWDVATTAQNLGTIPTGTPPADLTYTYDASDNRVLKSATAKELNNVDVQRHSVYISGGQELRGAKFAPDYLDAGATGADYQIDSTTEIAYLFAHGVRLGRVAYDNGTGMPAYTANAFLPAQHVLINLDDTLGSTSIVIDRATSELVEASSYLAHGATESDYRPDRWNGLREDYRFTGKEEDIEVGLQYFGKRFLSPYLNRWVSADPLAVHVPGKADWNLYAYVLGQALRSVDPAGLDEDFAEGRTIMRQYAARLPSADTNDVMRPGMGGILQKVATLAVSVHDHRYENKTTWGTYDSRTRSLYMESSIWRYARDTRVGELTTEGAMQGRRTMVHESFHAYEDLVLKKDPGYQSLVAASTDKYYARFAPGHASAERAREEAFAEYATVRASAYMNAQDELARLVGQNALTRSEYGRIKSQFEIAIKSAGSVSVGYYQRDDGTQSQRLAPIDPHAKPWLDEMSGISDNFDQNQGLAHYRSSVVDEKKSDK